MVEVWVSRGGAPPTGMVPSEEATWDPDSDAGTCPDSSTTGKPDLRLCFS